MHEWALADAVVAKVLDVMRERGIAAPSEVVLALGELQDIDRPAFEMGLEGAVAANPALATTDFTFGVDKARCTCRACGLEWELDDSLDALPEEDRESVHLLPELVGMYVSCPSCGVPDFAISGGRGVSIVAINA